MPKKTTTPETDLTPTTPETTTVHTETDQILIVLTLAAAHLLTGFQSLGSKGGQEAIVHGITVLTFVTDVLQEKTVDIEETITDFNNAAKFLANNGVSL